MGLSQNRRRRVIGDDHVDRGQPGGRRASSFMTMQVLRGHSRESLRPPTDVVGPPHPLPKAEHRAVASSFFSFERDPHDLGLSPFQKDKILQFMEFVIQTLKPQ